MASDYSFNSQSRPGMPPSPALTAPPVAAPSLPPPPRMAAMAPGMITPSPRSLMAQPAMPAEAPQPAATPYSTTGLQPYRGTAGTYGQFVNFQKQADQAANEYKTRSFEKWWQQQQQKLAPQAPSMPPAPLAPNLANRAFSGQIDDVSGASLAPTPAPQASPGQPQMGQADALGRQFGIARGQVSGLGKPARPMTDAEYIQNIKQSVQGKYGKGMLGDDLDSDPRMAQLNQRSQQITTDRIGGIPVPQADHYRNQVGYAQQGQQNAYNLANTQLQIPLQREAIRAQGALGVAQERGNAARDVASTRATAYTQHAQQMADLSQQRLDMLKQQAAQRKLTAEEQAEQKYWQGQQSLAAGIVKSLGASSADKVTARETMQTAGEKGKPAAKGPSLPPAPAGMTGAWQNPNGTTTIPPGPQGAPQQAGPQASVNPKVKGAPLAKNAQGHVIANVNGRWVDAQTLQAVA